MDLESAIQIGASGLKADRTWINVLSSNLANMNTTKTGDGVPYTRKTVIYEAVPSEGFAGELSAAMDGGAEKVQVADIVPDQRDFRQVYDPGNPDADAKGIVLMPNVNPVEEMANLITASRSYEANLAAMQTSRQLALKSMEIGAK